MAPAAGSSDALTPARAAPTLNVPRSAASVSRTSWPEVGAARAASSGATYQATRALAEKMGKTTVVSKDMPGFIVNRILIPMLNEACFALMEGLGTAEDIDTAMKLGTNQPMGPLQLADFIGLDTCLYIAEVLHKGLGDSKYRPCPLLRQYVDAGWYGKKSGRGFYKY